FSLLPIFRGRTMSEFSLTCPECQATLHAAKPVPAGRMIRCPQCGEHFSADGPQDLIVRTVPAASPTTKAGLVAFALVGMLAVGLAVGIMVAAGLRREPARPAAAPAPDRSAEDARLAELQR